MVILSCGPLSQADFGIGIDPPPDLLADSPGRLHLIHLNGQSPWFLAQAIV